MARSFSKELVLVAGFLGIIAAPAIIQTAGELGRGESPQALEVFRQAPAARTLRRYEQDMEDASVVARHLRPLVQYAQYRLLREAGDKALIGREGWMFYKPGFRYLTERPARHTRAEPTNAPLAAIVGFRDDLAKRGIRLLVMVAPNKESIHPAQLSRRARPLDVLVCSQTRQLMDELRRAGVSVLDLFEIYRAARRDVLPENAPPFYLVQDSHWSPDGIEFAARAAARRVIDSGWIQRGAVVYDVRPVTVRRLGDVIRMLKIPQLEREIAPEVIPCRQIIRQDTRKPYQDDPDSDILVLGDSFLRIYQQDEPASAGFVAHLACELQQPLATIVNDGGASTLVRQELFRRPQLLAGKKLVIWEFVERDLRFGTEGWQSVPLPPAAVR